MGLLTQMPFRTVVREFQQGLWALTYFSRSVCVIYSSSLVYMVIVKQRFAALSPPVGKSVDWNDV